MKVNCDARENFSLNSIKFINYSWKKNMAQMDTL